MLESRPVRAPDGPSGGLPVSATPTPAVTNGSTPTPRARPLEALLTGAGPFELRGDGATTILDVAYRSADARPGALFFCVPGGRADGHEFAPDAVAAGGAALVVERWLDDVAPGVAQVRVPSVRRAMGPLSAAFFGHPAERMTVIGVTGTNGKTTTTYLLESVFRTAGLVPGVVGTTGVRIDGRVVPFDKTTPEAPDLQRLLARMADEGVTAVAMEVSSHGLDQFRADGVRYACAVFTNLSQDHLDYHPSMRAYFEAKARLFTPELSERGAVNVDTPEGRELVSRGDIPLTTFGVSRDADVRAEDVEVSAHGVRFRVGDTPFASRLRGSFNVSNGLAAVAAARQVGIGDDAIARGIGALDGVPGRLEPVDAGQGFMVLVDYAHTPDSVENVLRVARPLTAGSLIAVIGCGGDRDRVKRPLMGEAATRFADLTVITSDNPRSEDPEAIIAEIVPGARRGGGRFVVEPDRRKAIRAALEAAAPGDLVIIAGKGHETGQEFRDRTIPFDDRIVARDELMAMRSGGADR
jgi:UDP-N-acetylmuramoyl-L-alanyl-D-glutamate--2,6-diaminopimelate ligase